MTDGFRSRASQLAGLPMFVPAQEAHAIQARLELDTEARYRAWLRSEDGGAIYRWMEARALAKAAAGATRIGSKALMEAAREEFQRTCDNRFTSLIARDLIIAHPELGKLIELRQDKMEKEAA